MVVMAARWGPSFFVRGAEMIPIFLFWLKMCTDQNHTDVLLSPHCPLVLSQIPDRYRKHALSMELFFCFYLWWVRRQPDAATD